MVDILHIIGAVVPVLSALASLVNQVIRSAKDAGKTVAPALVTTGVVLNAGAINVDKAVQLAKMLATGQARK